MPRCYLRAVRFGARSTACFRATAIRLKTTGRERRSSKVTIRESIRAARVAEHRTGKHGRSRDRRGRRAGRSERRLCRKRVRRTLEDYEWRGEKENGLLTRRNNPDRGQPGPTPQLGCRLGWHSRIEHTQKR